MAELEGYVSFSAGILTRTCEDSLELYFWILSERRDGLR